MGPMGALGCLLQHWVGVRAQGGVHSASPNVAFQALLPTHAHVPPHAHAPSDTTLYHLGPLLLFAHSHFSPAYPDIWQSERIANSSLLRLPQTRSRGFPDLTMPPGSSDKSQNPMGSGFPGGNLHPNSNIWSASLHTAANRSKGSFPSQSPSYICLESRSGARCDQGKIFYFHYNMCNADQSSHLDTEEGQSGSRALAANSEADRWASNSASKPWSAEGPQRSGSTSPNRTRDAPFSNGGLYDYAPATTIGMKKGSFGGKTFQEDAVSYGSAFPSQMRTAAPDASFLDALAAYPQGREQAMPPPSMQSQGSPALQDGYRGHTPSSSIHSQRPLGSQGHGYSTQSANQRAYDQNKQMQDDLATEFHRRLVMDSAAAATGAYDPSMSAFRLNPGSQSWKGEGRRSRNGGIQDMGVDQLAAQHAAIKRASVDRISPPPEYAFDEGTSPRNFSVAAQDIWQPHLSSRGLRSNGAERRGPAQQYSTKYPPSSYYSSPYPYNNVTQYQPSYLDPYNLSFRHPVLPTYGHQGVPSGYPGSSGQPPARPSRDQDPAKGARSVLLDDFRLSNKSSKRYELRDIYNHVVEFSGDQHGSRFIQQKLESANSDEKEQIFREIEPNSIQLMKDVFGNYVVQKFFEHGNQVQKKILAEKMKGKVVDLSVQVYACRVVQKALEHVLVEQQAELTRELEPDILRVVRDQNGNHVVQKIIELVPRRHIDFIMNALRGQVTSLASHTYGCRVIQRMLEHGTEQDKADIMRELHASAQILITDQYGNYVIQHVIQNGKPEDRAKIIALVMSYLLTMSKHKFASNVVEKCIEFGTPEQRTTVREQLTAIGSDGASLLQQMMRDQYGNYVIRK